MPDLPQDTTEEPQNLVTALQEANDESREFIATLEETAKVMGHRSADEDPGLALSKVLSLHLIGETERAIASGDVVEMLRAAAAHGIGQSEAKEATGS